MLTGAQLDRLAHRRQDEAWLVRTLNGADARMICVAPGQVLTDGDELRWAPTAGVIPDPTQYWILLGRSTDGAPRFALAHRADHPHAGDPAWRALRDLAAALSEVDAVCAAAAVALANWHAAHPRCPRCGTPTVVAGAGWLRRCPVDDSEHYPRTDAAVIMAVVDDADRILLGRNASWPEGRFSTLAGFVEPGETLEDAVRREVAEEVGVAVGAVSYQASQPWPFPASLMVGCRAQATSTNVCVDADEIAVAQWYTRDSFTTDVHEGRLRYPPVSSISHRLIEQWYGGPLPVPPGTW